MLLETPNISKAAKILGISKKTTTKYGGVLRKLGLLPKSKTGEHLIKLYSTHDKELVDRARTALFGTKKGGFSECFDENYTGPQDKIADAEETTAQISQHETEERSPFTPQIEKAPANSTVFGNATAEDVLSKYDISIDI